jgi:hypothetical protein
MHVLFERAICFADAYTRGCAVLPKSGLFAFCQSWCVNVYIRALFEKVVTIYPHNKTYIDEQKRIRRSAAER